MLEYGIKNVVTNPTLITKPKDIIRLIDSRTKETRAFVLPKEFEPYIKNWLKR